MSTGGEKMGADSTEGQISGGASLSDSWAVSGELFSIRNWQGRHFSQATLHGEVQYYLADECTAGLFCQRAVVRFLSPEERGGAGPVP